MNPYDELTRLGQLRRIRQLAEAVLQAYGLNGARLSFVQYTANIIYRVDGPGATPVRGDQGPYVPNRYLLRVLYTNHLEGVKGEMTWLAALGREAGLPVPEPVPTLEGELLTRITTPGVPKGRIVSLMRWIDGRRLTTGFRPSHFQAWGRMVARLHEFAAGWQPPEGFERPVWDWAGQLGGRYFRCSTEELVASMPEHLQEPFRIVSQEVRSVMESLGKEDQMKKISVCIILTFFLASCEPTESITPVTVTATPVTVTATPLLPTVTQIPPTNTPQPSPTPTSIDALNPTKTALPSDTPIPEEEIEPPADGLISPENAAQIEILHTLQGHGGQIVNFTFSPDDGQIVSLGSDLSLKRWDTNSGEEVHSLVLQGGPVYNGAISPIGDLFAIEGPNHAIQLRDTQDGQILREMAGHTSFVMSLNFSPDGSLLATGDSSGLIKVWETETGQLVHSLSGHPSPVGALTFSPGNTLLASGGVEGSQDIKIWDLARGQEIASLEKHSDNVYDLAFSPDGTMLASASGDRTLKLWDLESGQETQTFRGHLSHVYSVVFSPDGKLLASSDFDGNIKLWDIASGGELNNLKAHTDLVDPVKFSSNGCLLASGSFDSTIILWGIRRGICLNEPETKSSSLSSSEDGLIAFYSERDGDAEIFVMKPDGSDQRPLTDNNADDFSPSWSPDGTLIVFESDRDDPRSFVPWSVHWSGGSEYLEGSYSHTRLDRKGLRCR